MRVRCDKIYHLTCFRCAWCDVTLSQGDYFGICGNLVYCRVHYEMRNLPNPNLDYPFFPSSEHAIYPLSEHGNHPFSNLPLYSSMYGSPTSGHHGLSSLPSEALMSNQKLGATTRTSGPMTTCGPKKGRPRKRKVDPAPSKLYADELGMKSFIIKRSTAEHEASFGHSLGLTQLPSSGKTICSLFAN